MTKQFRLWAMCCSHVGTDLGFGRESLADAIRQSEQGGEEGGPAFDWDIAVVLGDHSGGQTTPTDEEGREIVRQFSVSARHPREHFYTVVGNHDAPIEVDAPLQWWARKWIDPTGEDPEHSEVNAERMPHAVEGTWERYTFAVGNRFLMMSDRNDFPPPVGRRGATHGGYPSGAVTSETFDWWRRYLEANEDSVLVSTHHHMLKETTVASGPWEGHVPDGQGSWTSGYHGYFADGGPEGSSYLYFLDDKPDAQAFEGYLSDNPGSLGPVAGRPYAHQPGRSQGRAVTRRAEVGLHVHQRGGVEQTPR